MIFKRVLFVTCLFCVATMGFCQGNAIGFHATTTEYIGDLNANNPEIYQFRFINYGGGISLQQRINSSFNLVEMLSYDKVQYQSLDKTLGVDASFYTLNLKLKYKFNNGYILGENAVIAPFIVAGVGGTYFNSKQLGTTQIPFAINDFRTDLAAGAGFVIRFSEAVYLELASTLHNPLYNGWDGVTNGNNAMYLQHSAGLLFSLPKRADADKDGVKDSKDECPNTPPNTKVDARGCPVTATIKNVRTANDRDGDGVPDNIDRCPDQPGYPGLGGCPDRDGDRIPDIDDKCPDVYGLRQFSGCPDTDGDGVEDSKDQCPNTPAGSNVDANGCPIAADDDGDGVPNNRDQCPRTPKGQAVNYYGCPATNESADNDGDGVPNSRDKCPNTYGSSNNYGCPEIREEVKKRLEFAAHGIYFETGKATIKSLSYSVLDDVASILAEYKDYDVRLGGHTDDVGSDASNLRLSQARVNAVKAYFTRKGISSNRMEATGYGESKPVASNATVDGRAENRRVEIELYLK